MGLTSATYLAKLRRIRLFAAFFCFLGLSLSLYAYYVEYKKELDASYTAMCDINEHVSCSQVFSSKYGKGFGLLQLVLDEKSPLIQPNSVYGIAFYLIVLVLGLGNYVFMARLQMITCCLANLGSVYLGYILYFILEDMCIVCISTYVVNFFLLISSLMRLSNLKQLKAETGGPIIYGGQSKKRV